jgi:photosystem I subunit 3
MKFITKNLTVIIASLLFFNISESKAEFSNLVPCDQSSNFQKRLNSSIKKLENRLKLYNSENKALTKEIEATKARFERYSNSNLLCGKEGLPRIIATGQWDHANEFVIPGVLFLYITGWIGWVSRKYLNYASTTENAFENEIIINVPIALSIMNSGFLWPVDAWKEFMAGDLLISQENESTSPR